MKANFPYGSVNDAPVGVIGAHGPVRDPRVSRFSEAQRFRTALSAIPDVTNGNPANIQRAVKTLTEVMQFLLDELR